MEKFAKYLREDRSAIRVPESEMNFAPCAARISLARRSFSVGGCSMKITEDVKKFAAEQKCRKTKRCKPE